MEEEGERETRGRKLSRWRRIKQDIAPQQTWLMELVGEAAGELRDSHLWLKRLNSPNRHIRQQAQREFQQLPRMARMLLTVQAYSRVQTQSACVGLLTGLVGIVAVLIGYEIGHMPGLAWGLIVAGFLSSIATSYLFTSRISETAKNLLDSCQDELLVPFLLMHLAQIRASGRAPRQMNLGRNQRNALVRLLPQVQEADAADWTGTHWRHLLYYLRHPYIDVDLTVTILQVMQRVGNEDAAKQIRALMNLSPSLNDKTSIGKSRAAWESNKSLIEQAAAQCLPGLEARLELQRQSQTLLRASGNEAAPSGNILLRPASALISETPAEQLLRPQSVE